MLAGSAALLERLRLSMAPDFTVEREIARGGMGTVFLGQDVRLQRLVAIKVLRPELATAIGAERFLREARALASLSHPNIVPIHSVEERNGLLYYVMEYIPEETLAARVARGPLPLPEVLRLGDDLLRALETAHRVVIHRDIKPSNIFLRDGRAVLADFGIARPSGDSPDSITETGGLVGTPAYMAIEQTAGGTVTPQTDLFAVGLVLYEASTGRRLPPLTPMEQVDWSPVPASLRPVLRRALQWNPRDRWPDAAAFRQALARVRPGRRVSSPARIAAVVLALLLVWVSGQALRDRLRRISPTCPARADLALLPFEVGQGITGLDGEDFARLVEARLDWFGHLALAPRECVAPHRGAAPGRGAGDTRAAYRAEGRLVPRGSQTVLSLAVLRQGQRFETLDIPGDAEHVLGWSRLAADSLVARLFPDRWDEYHELAAGSSARTSLQAWRHYFSGERAFQRGAYRFASAQYDSALALDSNFVQAAWRRGIARRFLRQPFEDDLRQLLVRHPGLPERYRYLIEALLEPNLARRFALYRRTVDAFPRDGYARFVYADELFHRGPLIGIPLDSALAQFDSTVKVDSYLDQMPAYDHLLWINLSLGRRTGADSALDHRLRIRPSGEPEDARRRRLFRLAYDFRFDRPLASLKVWGVRVAADSGILEGLNRYLRLGPSLDIPGAMAPIGRMLVDRGRAPHLRANGYMGIGLGELMTGRPMAALSHLDSAAALFAQPVSGGSPPASFHPVDSLLEQAEWRVMPGVLGLPGITEAEVTRGRRLLETLVAEGRSVPRAAFALAAEAGHLGDTATARRYAGLVRELAPRDSGVARLARLLDAMDLAAAGRFDSALALAAPLAHYGPHGALVDPFSRSLLYLSQARWQRSAGRPALAAQALLWYQNSDGGIEGWPQWQLEPGDVDNVLGAYARLLRAEAALEERDTATACPLLARVRELWQDAEPGWAPLIERAGRAAQDCAR